MKVDVARRTLLILPSDDGVTIHVDATDNLRRTWHMHLPSFIVPEPVRQFLHDTRGATGRDAQFTILIVGVGGGIGQGIVMVENITDRTISLRGSGPAPDITLPTVAPSVPRILGGRFA